MEKKVNLLGIRKKVILCHTKSLAGVTYTVMRPITEEDEQNLDKWECINVDGKRIDKKDIYCYGEINLSSNDDVEYIKKFSLLDTDNGGTVHSNFNYQEGYALVEGIAKTYPTFDIIEWFKYNHCLIGKPTRIIIYKSTMADAIESYIKDLDCTTIYPDGSRPRQTINYGYRITLSSIEYILDKLYLVLEHHPEKAQSYIDYRNSIIKRIIDIHEKNLDFERRNPVRYYSKEPRKRTRSASRVNQSKDVFTGKPIDVSTGIAKAIKPKKETIAQRKAKLLGGKAVSFAFNGLKISEHNE